VELAHTLGHLVFDEVFAAVGQGHPVTDFPGFVGDSFRHGLSSYWAWIDGGGYAV
jgi:hypothetical protein